MTQKHRRFNYFGCDEPFILPPPIPEPPRVINVKPMVPDLSLTSDIVSPNVSPKASPNKAFFDINRRYYPSVVPKPRLPQPNQLIASREQSSDDNFDNSLTKPKLCETEAKNSCSDASNRNQVIDRNVSVVNKRFEALPSNLKITDITSKTSTKPKSRQNLEPKVIKHCFDPISNKCRKPSAVLNRTNDRFSPITPSNEQMYELIKQQDQCLQKISEQIEELLRFHKIQEKSVNDAKQEKCIEKRSVMTMTSMVWDNKLNTTSRTKPQSRVTNVNSSTPKTPSTTSKDMRVLHFQTASECDSHECVVDIDSDRLDFTNSPNRMGCSSNEMLPININDCDDLYYDHMMGNIQDLLSDRSNDGTEGSGRRSSCSPTPPSLMRDHIHNNNRIHIQSEQTLYIKKLAAKYLVDDQTIGQTKSKCKQKKRYQNDEQTNLRIYGLPNNASIATKNYLEKYGLVYKNSSPPRVLKTQQKCDNYKIRDHNHRNPCQSSKNRLLDIETLKRQPKLT